MPVICSRRTRLTVSTDSCILRNHGTIRTTIEPTITPSSGTATATNHDRPTSSRKAMKMPPIIMIGIETMNIRPMLSTVCTWVTSLVLREIRVGAPNRDSSCAENAPTRSKTAPRRSRATAAEEKDAAYATPAVARMLRTVTASMTAPVRRM